MNYIEFFSKNWKPIVLVLASIATLAKIFLTQSVSEEDLKIIHEIIESAAS